MKESRKWRGKRPEPAVLETRRPQKSAAKKPPARRAAVDLELLAAIKAWAGARRGESASGEALDVAEQTGRFRLRGALDKFFRHYARLNWILGTAGLPQTPDMLWGAHSVLLEGLDPDAVARPIAVTTADIRGLARGLGRLSAASLTAPDMPEAVALECPDDLFPALRAAFGPRLRQELTALNLPAPQDIRVNILRSDRETLTAALAAREIELRPTPYAPHALRTRGRPDLAATEEFQSGRFEVQDEGSQLVAALVGAKPGQQVLDFCAGAGGKTLALAADMANRGHLVAADTSQRRLTRAKLRLKRAGVENAERVLLTGQDDDPFLRRRRGWFDRVLVDAPCSGTGAWRRHPETKWQADRDVSRLNSLQDSILARVAPLVKRGGRLIYATCSVLPAENEGRVTAFLSKNSDFHLIPAAQLWAEQLHVPWPCTGTDMLNLTPAQHGTDGFFAAVLERR
ncbi:MAG: RsmB/NOP family class I SAM-dependent RNA methyltransferase [Alphaproteobacteria bacterium]|nr:RsmB/NOP family class I SAM-dependent RNA methyltransferase [Alphaproteobacteria bacterium]